MTLPTLGIDAYQLTTLLTHADEGRLDHDVSMAFFFRRMPKHRNFVLVAGLTRILAHAAQLAIAPEEIEALLRHSALGPALRARPAVVERLRALSGFAGAIDAMPEGSVAFAGPASRTDGSPFLLGGAPFSIYTPILQVKTDMLRAKLIETPWLGFFNHMSMVASKAARVVLAARGKSVMEFGQRRTHPAAALDATYAAWVAGISATSNIGAYVKWGVTATGTMDHFAVQASERPGQSRAASEREFFAAYQKTYDGLPTTMLVDTYDTEQGIAHAVQAAGSTLGAVRLDSNVTKETIARAREQLVELGAPDAKIFVSDGLDEHRVAELAELADGFGIGENIVCSPDSSVGVGAVAKLVVNGYGAITMKVARGTGKATLPGELQVYRYADHDLVALASEPAPGGGSRAMLGPVWRGTAPVDPKPEAAALEAARVHAASEMLALPEDLKALDRASPRKLVASDALVRQIERLVAEAA